MNILSAISFVIVTSSRQTAANIFVHITSSPSTSTKNQTLIPMESGRSTFSPSYSTSMPLRNSPTDSPTSSPTTTPYPLPYKPSTRPSIIHATSPPSYPLAIQTNKPIFALTIDNKVSQSLSPTMRPTNVTKSETTPCATNASGFFGSAASNSVLLSYNYRIEVKNTTALPNTLFHLETAINDALLPSLFPLSCKSNTRFRRTLTNSTTNPSWESLLVGISTFPLDIAESGTLIDFDCVTGFIIEAIKPQYLIFTFIYIWCRSLHRERGLWFSMLQCPRSTHTILLRKCKCHCILCNEHNCAIDYSNIHGQRSIALCGCQYDPFIVPGRWKFQSRPIRKHKQYANHTQSKGSIDSYLWMDSFSPNYRSNHGFRCIPSSIASIYNQSKSKSRWFVSFSPARRR